MINITYEQLYKLLQDVGEAAVMAYKRDVEPKSDRINQAEAKKWISSMGYKPVMLKKWVNSGLLTREKNCDAAQNAQAFYSKTELKRLMSALEVSTM